MEKDISLKEWDPGFRVGLGWTFGHDGWDLYANYTWFYNDADGSKSDSAASASTVANSLIEIWALPIVSTPFVSAPYQESLSSAKANWNLHFDTLDLGLGRNFFISKFLKLRPNFGLQAAWLNQHDTLTATTTVPVVATGTREIHVHQKQDFWGVGPRTALNSAWQFIQCWSLFGDVGISALYGHFHSHRKDKIIQGNSGISPVPNTAYIATNIKEGFYTLQPIVELALGLRWETCVSDDKYHIGFQAGWEEQVWFDHNRYITFGDDHSGNLAMQGLTLKGCFGF